MSDTAAATTTTKETTTTTVKRDSDSTSRPVKQKKEVSKVTFRDDAPPERESKVETKSADEINPPSLVDLRRWSELPEWQKQEDKIIYGGYRESTPSVFECVKSLFYLHNESINILSHLGGAVLFVVLAFVLYFELSRRYPSWTIGDVVAIGCFMFGVAVCFTLSAAFHTCSSHSAEGYHLSRRLDFQGIIVLVLGTTAPQIYYTFHDNLTLQRQYWSFISALGLMASIMTFTPFFQRPSQYAARVAIFAGLGLSTFAPIVHGCIVHGFEEQNLRFPLWVIGLTHSFNIFGAVVYVLHFPERWWPRTFDIFGASHQLMHVAIVGAALALLVGSVIAFDHVHEPKSARAFSGWLA